VDIYENCVKLQYGLETAVAFIPIVRKDPGWTIDPNLRPTAHDLLVECAATARE
jgi:hypothetical protein